MVGRASMFPWALQCRFRQFEKVANFMVRQALSCLTLQVLKEGEGRSDLS